MIVRMQGSIITGVAEATFESVAKLRYFGNERNKSKLY
jgi:hypothetical protein